MSLVRALSRTTRLINQQFFDSNIDDEDAIAAGLVATTVRLVADEANMASRAGQAALVTTTQLVARLGIQIQLAVPDIPLINHIPPLRCATLLAALLELGTDLLPGVHITTATDQPTDLTFCFGDTTNDTNDAIYLTASPLGCRLTRDPTQAIRIDSATAIGALAAGAAAAAISLDAALPNIEQATNTTRSKRVQPSPGPPVDIDLAQLFPGIDPLAERDNPIDIVSGGAVANAFISTQLWLPHNHTTIRLLDDDHVELENLNRCSQFRRSDTEQHLSKAEALARSSTSTLCITGVPERHTDANRDRVLPFAEHVVVGVDSIPARWRIQEAQPQNLYVGSTNNHEAVLTTHHPSQPCAGCAHPDDENPDDQDFVPTISFVSFWTGLLQSCALLAETTQPHPSRRMTVNPFALGEQRWSSSTDLPTGARCPLQCDASQKPSAPVS